MPNDFMDKFLVDIQMRWSIQHPIMKTGDVQAALVTIDGGFIDHCTRKLTIPSKEVIEAFQQMPKGLTFTWLD